MQLIKNLGAAYLTLCLMTACTETDGPSLVGAGSGTGTTTPATFLNFTNGQAAFTVIGQTDFISSGSGHSQSQLFDPSAGKIGASGTLWVVDQFNNRVLGFTAIPTVPGPNADLVIGQPNFTSTVPGSGSNQFDNPLSAHDNGSQLFVADNTNHRILVFNTIPTTNNPNADFAIGAANPNVAGAGTCTQNTMHSPLDLYATSAHLFVVDDVCNRVVVYDMPITSNQPNAMRVIGQSDFTSSTPGVSSTMIDNPTSVWSNDTRIVVVDANNNRVLLYNSFPSADGAAADVVLGQVDFTSSVRAATDHNFGVAPSGVTSNGVQVFVGDMDNCRIMIWNTWPTSNGQAADGVLGQSDFTSSAPNVTQFGLSYAKLLSVSNQYLTIADTAANRVMVWKTQ